MIRHLLAAVWSMTSPHRRFLVNFLLPIGLSLLACSALAGWSAERDAREQNDGEHAKAIHLADVNIAGITRAYLRDEDSLAKLGRLGTETRTKYRTVRDTLLLEFERAHSEVVALLPHLPAFIQRADGAVTACAEYQQFASVPMATSADALIAAQRHKSELLEHAAVWKPPRWTVEGETLYDPIASVPMASGAGTFRLGSGVAVVVRGEQRFAPGERPRAYVGIRVTR